MGDFFLYKRGVEHLNKFFLTETPTYKKRGTLKMFIHSFDTSLKKEVEIVNRALINLSLIMNCIKRHKYKNAFAYSKSLEFVHYLSPEREKMDCSNIYIAILYLRLFIGIQLLKTVAFDKEYIKIKYWLGTYFYEEILSAYDLFCDIKSKLNQLINEKICMKCLSESRELKDLQSKLEVYYKYLFSKKEVIDD